MSDWIEWYGGEMPVEAGARVAVEFRDSSQWEGDARSLVWEHFGGPGDVMSYRVIEAPKETHASTFDVQVGGSHYKDFKIQPTEFIMANGLDFCQGNVVKYVCRFRHKNGLQDLEKAKHYIEMLIELERVK